MFAATESLELLLLSPKFPVTASASMDRRAPLRGNGTRLGMSTLQFVAQ